MKAFRQAAARLRRPIRCLGTDTTELSPALQLCDERFLVAPITQPQYLKQLRSIVRTQQVDLLVPTVDLDLRLLAEHKQEFERLGCRVLVSDPDVIDTCQDKRKTYRFLRQHGFDVPQTWSVAAALAADRKGEFRWPCFLKPWDGHAGKGTTVVFDRQELLYLSQRVPRAICQKLIDGTEFTCDVYVSFDRCVRCVVPRQRLEVRSGEVSKARIVKHPHIMQEAARLIERLGAGPGVITIQLFETARKQLQFIEINPRFGGGAPLSIQAGADFPRWILQELAGRRPRIGFDAFEDGLTMLRYDAEVWLTDAQAKGVKIGRLKA
ncbi:MAG: ATP-grasp domain-containing protein [Sedimentisphaerales bacterium]|nr:ATP-grasp domain-containing protein [Sedimentisphaerales bacterium]